MRKKSFSPPGAHPRKGKGANRYRFGGAAYILPYPAAFDKREKRHKARCPLPAGKLFTGAEVVIDNRTNGVIQ